MNDQRNEVVVAQRAAHDMTIADVRSHVGLVRQVLDEVMVEGHHYGSVPGSKGQVLFKAGAEKLAMVFRLAPTFEVQSKDLPNGHREYVVTCVMHHAGSGVLLGSGVGSATTMEKKHRYRYRGEGRNRVREENPDIADSYNTVLKMAKKRAQVDATLTVTGASDIFAPDLEDADDAPPPPPPKVTEHELLVQECGEMAKRYGGDAERIAAIVAKAGVSAGKRFGDRSIGELRQLKDAMAADLAAGSEA